jgi:hypothetical protein
MIEFILVFLLISQAITFYFLITNKKIFVKVKPKGIILEEYPKDIKFKDVHPDYQIVYDIFESIKLENWNSEIEQDFSSSRSRTWQLNFNSHDFEISVMCRLRMYSDEEVRLSNLIIRTKTDSIALGKEDSIANDIIIFFWKYIVEDKNNYNKEVYKSYEQSVDNISSKLKTLNRSKKLKSILEDESN